jgi:hypothetical protein
MLSSLPEGVTMRPARSAVLPIVFVAFISCGKQDESAEHPDETPATEAVQGSPQSGTAESNERSAESPAVDLRSAVVAGDLVAIRQHITTGSDLNVIEPSRESTPLITASVLGRTDAARLLIDAGADLDYQNKDGSTALHMAAFFCREEIVRALLEKGADKTLENNTGQTARETIELPFEDVKYFYDAVGAELDAAGVRLDYDHIEATRPRIAEILD